VFDDELARFVALYGDRETAIAIVEEDHKDALANARKPIIRFYVDRRYRWDSIRNHPTDGTLGEFVTEAMRTVAWDNPDLQGVLDVKDYNERQSGVLDTGAVSRGLGSKNANKDRSIRRAMVEADLIEGVALLPENLFYNTTAPGIVLLLNRAKPAARRGQILLVNASAYLVKRKPKNELTAEGIAAVVDAYRAWETRQRLSRVVTLEEVRAADYNLSPSQFVEVNDRAQHRPLGAILANLHEARIERERADAALDEELRRLSLSELA